MNNKRSWYVASMALGALLLAAGGLLGRSETFFALSAILRYGGLMVFGLAAGGLLSLDNAPADPDRERQERRQNDERNTAIWEKAITRTSNVTDLLLLCACFVLAALDLPGWVRWVPMGVLLVKLVLTGMFVLWYRRKL